MNRDEIEIGQRTEQERQERERNRNLRIILAFEDRLRERSETWTKPSPVGTQIALNIQRNFEFPGDDAEK